MSLFAQYYNGDTIIPKFLGLEKREDGKICVKHFTSLSKVTLTKE